MPEEGTRHHDRRHYGFIVGRRVQADSLLRFLLIERIGSPARRIRDDLDHVPRECPSRRSPGEEAPAPSPTPTIRPPSATPSPRPTAQASCAQQVLNRMSMPLRIGQLFSVGLANNRLGAAELSAIRNQHVGSVWFTATTFIGVAGIRAVVNAVQAHATSAATAPVRFFIAADQEGGLIQAL